MGQTMAAINKDDINHIFKNVIQQKDVSRADFKLIKLLSIKNRTKIYLVERYTTKQRYAMKIIDKYSLYNEGRVEQVLQGLKIQSTISHKFILKIHYIFQDDVNLFIITDYCKGSDLQWQMKFHEVFSEKETIFIISCLILALEKIHSENIVNVGLTLEHILLDEKGYPKITDFSQAVCLDSINQMNQDILNNDLITEFLAPEVILRQIPGIEADYYSLGIIMCYMMSGRKQEENLNMTREILINNILKKNIKNVKQSDLPEGWTDFAGDFINKLTQKKPQNRLGYYGAEEIKKHKLLQNEPWQKIEEGSIMDCYVPKIKKVETSFLSRIYSKDDTIQQNQEKENQLPKSALKLMRRLSFQEAFESFYYSIDRNINSERTYMQDEIKSIKSSNNNYQTPSLYQSVHQQNMEDIDSDRNIQLPFKQQTPYM